MDPSLLTQPVFWEDHRPHAVRDVPDLPELQGHVLFETSGSTGTPKWIALSKPALLASASAVNRHFQITPDSVWGLALPVHHVGGFGVAARAYEAGCKMAVFPGKWDPVAFQKWCLDQTVSHTSLVPTQVHDLVRAGVRAPDSLVAIVVGGGRLETPMGQAARGLGWPVLASYGMTEACSQVATQHPHQTKDPYQPSPLPILPIWQTRLTDDQRLEISGPALFSGTLVGDRFTPRHYAWHPTADRVSLSPEGLSPLSRADTLVKILGELVDPESIERELAARSDRALVVGTFAVVAVPDARSGHRLVPVFDATSDRDAVAKVLLDYRSHAPGFRRLGDPLWRDELPRTDLGKIRRGQLTEWCAARQE